MNPAAGLVVLELLRRLLDRILPDRKGEPVKDIVQDKLAETSTKVGAAQLAALLAMLGLDSAIADAVAGIVIGALALYEIWRRERTRAT